MNEKRYEDAYYTVEAVFIVSICVWILIALCYGGFYVHDRLLLASELNEQTAEWICSGAEKTDEWCEDRKNGIQKKLFLFQITSIRVKNELAARNIQVTYTVPISWSTMKKLFTGKSSSVTYETEREMVQPADYMWTFGNRSGTE